MTEAMEVDAFLADSVVSADGKLYVHGAGWDVITTQSLPVRHSRIGIGVIIHVPYTATNQAHDLEVRLEDADGQVVALSSRPPSESGAEPVTKFSGQFNVGRPPTLPPGSAQIVAIAMQIDGMLFEKVGGYRFIVSIDGSDVKALPFRLTTPPNIILR
jgi:hypothetical protein